MPTRVLIVEGDLMIIQMVMATLRASGCAVVGVVRLLASPKPGQRLRVLLADADCTGTLVGELDLDQPFDIALLDHNAGWPNSEALLPLLAKSNTFLICLSDDQDGHDALFGAEPGAHIGLRSKMDLAGLLHGTAEVADLVWRDDFDAPRDGPAVLDHLYKQLGVRRKT